MAHKVLLTDHKFSCFLVVSAVARTHKLPKHLIINASFHDVVASLLQFRKWITSTRIVPTRAKKWHNFPVQNVGWPHSKLPSQKITKTTTTTCLTSHRQKRRKGSYKALHNNSYLGKLRILILNDAYFARKCDIRVTCLLISNHKPLIQFAVQRLGNV